MKIGANIKENNQTSFRVWAPQSERVSLILGNGASFEMQAEKDGYWSIELENCGAGTRYAYSLDWSEALPDPCSRFQPDGVFAFSEVVDPHRFSWADRDWQVPDLADWILYEIHIGTFTSEGSFDAAISKLDYLKELGVNAVELMPLAQTSGDRSWGYDGVLLYAVQKAYGDSEALKRFVDAAHRKGIAVILDVVYNHLGPEGNVLHRYGPYFNDKYQTPWGSAVNLDGAYSDFVREYFIENALYWLREFHLDGLRLDAVHELHDESARPFLAQLSDEVKAYAERCGRRKFLIAESSANDPRTVSPTDQNGFGMDAQWADDFHHAVYTLLTGDSRSYYSGYGRIEDLAKAYRDAFVYTGQYFDFLKRRYGRAPLKQSASSFVVCIQNHDRVGNRMKGERLSHYLDLPRLKLAIFNLLLSPFVPLLFMGEETANPSPFLFFASFQNPKLQSAVRQGRKQEFADFKWEGEVPDPLSLESFERSKLDWNMEKDPMRVEIFNFYRSLIRLRQSKKLLRYGGKEGEASDRGLKSFVPVGKRLLLILRYWGEKKILLAMNFESETQEVVHEWVHQKGQILADTLLPFPRAKEETSSLSLSPWQAVLIEGE